MPARINLDALASPARMTIDAAWSKRKKAVVAGACIALTVAAIGGGAWAYMHFTPPAFPTTAAEAVAALKSDQFGRLDELRQRQYASEAMRLIRLMPDDERRELMRDESNREAMGRMREEMMDEAARKYARGEPLENPWGGGQRPAGQGPRPGGPDPNAKPPTDAERQQRMKEMKEKINQRMNQMFQTGNAQSGGLRGEMFKRMFSGAGPKPGPR